MRDEAPCLRVGRIPFLVCAPYFHDSLDGAPGIAFTDGVPRALNDLFRRGEIDCAPSSSFEYARDPDAYMLLPGLCTSGRGEVKSVLLLSDVPWEELGDRAVALSGDSDTSNALVQVLSRRRYEVAPEFVPPGADASAAVAKVAIGDRALREAASGRWPYRYDLARAWQEWTGDPLPLGVWILRAEAAAELPQVVAAWLARLHAALESFFRDPDAALDRWERAFGLPLDRAAAHDFFSTTDYALTPAHARALTAFFDHCADLGLIARPAPLRWFEMTMQQ